MPDTAEIPEITFASPMPSSMEGPSSLPAPVIEGQPPAVQQIEPGTLLQVIARVASDPTADIEKMDRLLKMQERMQERQDRIEYDNAMSAAQEEMQPIRANMENPQTRSEYADYAALDRAIRPIYTRHGFSLSFRMGENAPPDHVRIVCAVACRGHREYPHIDMPADGKGARGGDVMTKTHATGAATTYGKRYLLGMIFNLAVTRDDDGNGAGGFENDDDIERNAPADAPRDKFGKLLSTYKAEVVKKARNLADKCVESLNLSNNPADVRAWRDWGEAVPSGKRKSPLQWLKDNAPGQYTRVRQAYQNVAGEDLE